MRRKFDKRFFRNESGAVAATYALALLPLIAIAGLGYDYTRLVGMDTELQNGADQAALAGATQLDRTDGSMQRAIAAIQGSLVQNTTLFSNDGTGSTIDIEAADICFYATKAEAEAGDPSTCFTDTTRYAEAGFVQVTVETRAANYALTPVVGALKGELAGAAVAGLGSALCRVPPLMICNPDEETGNLTMNVTGRAGFGLLAKPGGGGQWVPGNYGYLDIGLANGAVGVRQALGWGSAGNCIAQVGPSTVDTQTGNIANAPGAANTRFDVYENNACETGGDCPSAINVRKDMVRPVGSAASNGKSCEVDKTGWQLPTQADSYLPQSGTTAYPTTPKSMGHPRDMCHAVYEGGPNNCWDVDGNFGDGVWDRDTYFRTHYIRSDGTRWGHSDWQTNLAGALLDLDGIPGNDHTIDTISRYEVYKWEESNAGTVVDGATVLGDQTYTSSDSKSMLAKGRSICSAAHGYTPVSTPDRRKLSVAVVNCSKEGVNGSSTNVPVVQWVDIFLVQVAADRQYNGNHYTGKDELYVEIIAENTTRGTGSTDGITIRRDVPYLVR